MGHVTLTTSLSGMTCRHRLGLATTNLQTKLEVSNSSCYEDMKSSAKLQIVVVWGG